MLLCIRQMLAMSTRSTVAAVVYLCGERKEERGSSRKPSFAIVAPAHNLDWLGPGS